MPSNHRSPQLPLGTQVVLRESVTDASDQTAQRGATGRISAVTGDARYVVRFADGRQAVVRREQVSLRRSYHGSASSP